MPKRCRRKPSNGWSRRVVDAAGDTGESDPLLAIQDALQTFPADEIVLFTHAGGELNWLEEGVVEEARERFEIPVDHLIVESA